MKKERRTKGCWKDKLKEEIEKKAATKKSKKTDYNYMRCNASWKEEKKQSLNNIWIDCDSCKKSVHLKCISKNHLFKLDDFPYGDSDCDFLSENCDNEDEE